MTEEEAKTKWCPMAGESRFERQDERCLGSGCVMWRSHTRTETRHRDGHVVQRGEVYLRGNTTEHQVADGGYCGLAGAPQ